MEVGLWARTFQVVGNEEGPQLPDKQWSEPLKATTTTDINAH